MERSKDGVLVSKDGVVGSLAVFDYYVDSVNGSDDNDGLTAATAFASIGKLTTTVGGDFSGLRIGLARGGYWREQFGSQSNASSNVVVSAYGTGQLPVLDAADEVPAESWAKTDTYTNVYDLTWAHSASAGSTLSVWEDGVRLRWVSSIATCDATPGTYYVATVAGSSTALYLHASDSGDPDANGKLYEIATRDFGIAVGIGGSAWRVSNVRTKRQAHPDGSLAIYAPGSVVRGCIAEDGTKHNLFIGRDSAAYDCIAWKADWADRTNATLFVAFTGDGRGKRARFERCVAIVDPAVGADAVTNAKAIDGFYAHTSSGSQKWDQIEIVDCAAIGGVTSFGASDVEHFIVIRPFATNCRNGVGAGGTNTLTTVTDPYCRQGDGIAFGSSIIHYGGECAVEGLREYAWSGSNSGSVYTNAAGTLSVRKSVLVRGAASSGYRIMVNGNSAPTDITSEYNIIYTLEAVGSNGFKAKGAGAADFNVYYPASIDMEIGANAYTTFAAYQAAETAFDQNSIVADPLLVDPANGDFGLDPSSPAIALGAGLERPNIVYTAIPSDEEIEAM